LINLLALSQIAFEKFYSKLYGATNPMGRSVIQTEDHGYVVCSPFTNGNLRNFFMLKISPSGDTMKSKLFVGYATSTLLTSDNGFVIAGSKDGQMMLMKTNSNFEVQWTHLIGQCTFSQHSVCQSYDSGFCVIGDRSGGENMGRKLVIARTDKHGNTIWTKYLGDYYRDFAGRSIISTYDSGYLICGSYKPGPMTNARIFLLKLNHYGDSVWMKTYTTGNKEFSTGHVVVPSTDNGFLIAGYYNPIGTDQLFLIKTNSLGDTLWTKKYDCIYNSGFLSATTIKSGGYVVAGTAASTELWHSKVCLLRINEMGDTLWTKKIGTMTTEFAMSVKQTCDLGFIISGILSYPPSQNSDIYLIKTDSTGNYYPLSINDNRNIRIVIFPNPAKKTFNLEIGKPFNKLEIFDIYGKSVLYSIVYNKEESVYAITIENSRHGIYLLNIAIDNTIISKKVIMRN